MQIKQHPKHKEIFVSTTGKIFKEVPQFKRSTNNPIHYWGIAYKKFKYSVHRLVAETFLKNPENRPIVMHVDDNPQNNSVKNLRWGTYSENMQDAHNKGKFKSYKGPKPKTIKIIDAIINANGKSQRQIAEDFGVAESRISQIKYDYLSLTKNKAKYPNYR